MSEIASIVFKPVGVDETPGEYLRVELNEAILVAGFGIEGDVKGGHPKRHLNIMTYETLANLRTQGFMTDPGQMGEQIVVRALDVNPLASGTRVQLGESAVIEVIEPRNGCDRFEKIQKHPRSEAAGQMGIIAKVITGGTIKVGDPVHILPKA